MNTCLTKEIAYKSLQEICQQKLFVLFGTGTSCAVDRDFGMPALEKYLSDKIPLCKLNSGQQAQWDAVLQALKANRDFESAMNEVQDEALMQHVINHTANSLINLDRQIGLDIFEGKTEWPATNIFSKLLNGLPESDRILHVATPNYDLLAEYAFEKQQIPYSTGFVGGVCRCLDWKQVDRSMICHELIPRRRAKPKIIPKLKKHIRLYKVHGSLNTFRLINTIIENNAWMHAKPDGIERLMITPGTSKYQMLHQNRSELLGEYDQAIERHNAFLFIGFGFNDNQLCNDAIRRKLQEQQSSGLIITRSSNPRIEALMKSCKNLWLVCKEDGGADGTRIFNSQYDDSLILKDKQLWDSKKFADEILGG